MVPSSRTHPVTLGVSEPRPPRRGSPRPPGLRHGRALRAGAGGRGRAGRESIPSSRLPPASRACAVARAAVSGEGLKSAGHAQCWFWPWRGGHATLERRAKRSGQRRVQFTPPSLPPEPRSPRPALPPAALPPSLAPSSPRHMQLLPGRS